VREPESTSAAHLFDPLSRLRIEEDDMRTIMIRYKTTEAGAQTNETLVRAVFAELAERAPSGIRYASYRLDDGVSFVHIATVDAPERNPLVELPSFKRFQRDLEARCVEQPVITTLSPVGSYTA
jgi:hypothetical protein